ncbi:NADPH:quinone reductase-like Zn-dependent oxidoreductase [Duganella sp. 1224]|uniref:zinc-binding dehydrogenase n=1 Tax=Duganella sp. 1224 TaxID=2587052 RepID=UPI0015CD9AE5|nr:zinc-binding dehydrogenase [Duganella sp. 1224]NYE62772.1 NADPH:quinone reductase-like Zn-dependent oxidoreductase [Duganella sp. 1224]
MRSIIYHQYGEPAEVLHLTEAPELPPPSQGEVLIRVTHRPIHPGDLLGVRGRYRAPGNTAPVGVDGARPGFEGAGVIEAVGAGVDPALAPGARVAFFPARWAWSDKVIAPARFVTVTPDDVADAAAAQLHVAPLTAALLFRAVQDAGARRGDVVALSAAGGAVARLTAQLLHEAGYRAVGVVRSAAAVAALQEQAPYMGIVSTDQADWSKRIYAVTQGMPLRVALDPVGGAVASTLAALLDGGGTLVSYGDLSGQPLSVPALAFSTRDLRIGGVSVGRWPALPDAQRDADRATALRLARTAPALFRVAAEYPLDAIAAAVLHAEQPGKDGAVLLR